MKRQSRARAEAGAMRILGNHSLVIGLIDQLNLKRRRFHLVDVDHDAQPAARTWLYVNGIRMRRSDYVKGPDGLRVDKALPECLAG
ncbi:hypothetical protein ABT063_46385 [Streptomyces sp. NPDC002838]|uniref:hypothetical protein n=1 Tax=Streptomyces sp. NPDC002838 TaxID=3154436 RepID=UPI00332127E8